MSKDADEHSIGVVSSHHNHCTLLQYHGKKGRITRFRQNCIVWPRYGKPHGFHPVSSPLAWIRQLLVLVNSTTFLDTDSSYIHSLQSFHWYHARMVNWMWSEIMQLILHSLSLKLRQPYGIQRKKKQTALRTFISNIEMTRTERGHLRLTQTVFTTG